MAEKYNLEIQKTMDEAYQFFMQEEEKTVVYYDNKQDREKSVFQDGFIAGYTAALDKLTEFSKSCRVTIQ